MTAPDYKKLYYELLAETTLMPVPSQMVADGLAEYERRIIAGDVALFSTEIRVRESQADSYRRRAYTLPLGSVKRTQATNLCTINRGTAEGLRGIAVKKGIGAEVDACTRRVLTLRAIPD